MSHRLSRTITTGAAAILLLAAPLAFADLAQLEKGFAAPPDDAKIMTRWWWFGPSVAKPELEREMKMMKEGGFQGFEVQNTFPMEVDNPTSGIKNIDFLSAENLDNVGFVAAKAKEMGLRMDLTLGSGWPYGGPMFSIDEAPKAIKSTAVDLVAGARTADAPTLREGEKMIAAYAWDDAAGKKAYVEIKEGADKKYEIPAAVEKPTQVLFVYRGGANLMKVKRPAVGAEGYIIDHLSSEAIEKFIDDIAKKQIAACGPNPPTAVFCDSLEIAGENWSDNILDEFQKRRGYDLRPYLPDLLVDAGPEAPQIRRDWGLTLVEVFNAKFIERFTKLAHDNKTKFRIQAYGSPANMLSSYGLADMDEGEGPQWRSFSSSRWASSASHMLGRAVTSSEALTWLHSPVFRATPMDMKVEADLHFLSGINQLSVHGWPYTPPSVAYPGWRFYAAAVFDEKNPWWIVMPDVTKYLQRASWMLRQGAPANDVAIYLPTDDAMSRFGRAIDLHGSLSQAIGGQVYDQLLTAGYNMDCFDDTLLKEHAKIEGKDLVFENAHYKAVLLPGVESIPPATLHTFADFAKAGGIVIALRNVPTTAPGFKATEAEKKDVADTAAALFKGDGAKGTFVEQDSQLAAALGKSLKPDAAFDSASNEIGFQHRSVDGSEVYFVANTSNAPKKIGATFRVSGLVAELWDPMSGKTAATASSAADGGTKVDLDLPAYGSTFVVFSKTGDAAKPAMTTGTPKTLDLSGGWTVAFGKTGKTETMDKLHSWTDDDATRNFSGVATYERTVNVPADMTAGGTSVVLDFGEATPSGGGARGGRAGAPGAGARGGRGGGGGNQGRPTAQIDAPVREAAVVTINGQRVGSVWHPPYQLDVTSALKAGENKIQIEVANLAVNYLAAHPFGDHQALVAKYGSRFDEQNLDQIAPVASGLLGPLQLVATSQGK